MSDKVALQPPLESGGDPLIQASLRGVTLKDEVCLEHCGGRLAPKLVA